jgi:hypothetical protein
VMFNSHYAEVRKAAYYVFASCNSNNTFVQHASMDQGGFKLLNSVIQETSITSKEGAFAALSSLVRGESLVIKRNFIEMEGVEFLLEILSNDKTYSSNRMKIKVMTLINDLVFYDDKLNFPDMITYNKLDATSEKKVNEKTSKHISIKKEGNKDEEEKKTEVNDQGKPKESAEDLAKYKNIVKKKLIEKDFIHLGLKYLTKENLKAHLDLRTAYFSIVISLIQFNPKCKPSQEYFDQVSKFKEHLEEETKNHDNIFEQEIDLLKNLLFLK